MWYGGIRCNGIAFPTSISILVLGIQIRSKNSVSMGKPIPGRSWKGLLILEGYEKVQELANKVRPSFKKSPPFKEGGSKVIQKLFLG